MYRVSEDSVILERIKRSYLGLLKFVSTCAFEWFHVWDEMG